MDRINNAADTMGDLLSGLLEISRIGRVTNPPQIESLSSLVEKAADDMQKELGQGGVEPVTEDGLWQEWLDSAGIEVQSSA